MSFSTRVFGGGDDEYKNIQWVYLRQSMSDGEIIEMGEGSLSSCTFRFVEGTGRGCWTHHLNDTTQVLATMVPFFINCDVHRLLRLCRKYLRGAWFFLRL